MQTMMKAARTHEIDGALFIDTIAGLQPRLTDVPIRKRLVSNILANP